MNNTVIEILNYLGEKFNIAIDWTSENVVPYIQELFNKFIQWEISTSIAWIIIAVASAVILWIAFAILRRYDKKEDIDYNDVTIAAGVCAGIATIISIIVICFQTFDIIECRAFPEKALFDYIYYHTDILD